MITENKFWGWFLINKNDYLHLDMINEDEKEVLLNRLLTQLHEYCDSLYFQISNASKEGPNELVITAEGDPLFFENVEKLVKAAPSLTDWEIVAFKQPSGTAFVTQYEGLFLDPKKIWFMPLNNPKDSSKVGIRVCANNLDKTNMDRNIRGVKQLLDVILGEKDCNDMIDYFDVDDLSSYDVDKDGLMELVNLKEFLNWKKGRQTVD